MFCPKIHSAVFCMSWIFFVVYLIHIHINNNNSKTTYIPHSLNLTYQLTSLKIPSRFRNASQCVTTNNH